MSLGPTFGAAAAAASALLLGSLLTGCSQAVDCPDQLPAETVLVNSDASWPTGSRAELCVNDKCLVTAVDSASWSQSAPDLFNGIFNVRLTVTAPTGTSTSYANPNLAVPERSRRMDGSGCPVFGHFTLVARGHGLTLLAPA